jgi:asparagine synthase (glutamine-hydrolysing)
MCAIAGIIEHASGPAEAEAYVRTMLAAQQHRGPDGEGLWIDPAARIVLGHRRLAIVDLTDAARQPMTSRDGRWTIVFNGEIFNHLEIARELAMPLRTRSDTEVLLEACAAWGVERAVGRAVGMFAFALWDSLERRLTLARDRSGEKPLVYFSDGRTLAFASEIKALLPLAGRRLDAQAVDAYLALGYVPAPLAILRNCRKLAPGHLLEFRAGQVTSRRWWFPEGRAFPQAKSTQLAKIEALRDLIADAVRLRLRADVPLALYLSGGVDSSVIAQECVRAGADLDAFTVCFDNDLTDLPYARQVARQLGLRHHVIPAPATAALDALWTNYDEPFADSSSIPTLTLARSVAGRYKAVLNGDGGDEAFGGYRHYEFIGPKQVLKAAAAATGFADGAGGVGIYVQSKSTFRAVERAGLLNGNAPESPFSERLRSDEFLEAAPRSALARAMWSDRHLYLPNDLSYKMDIALGACGMEGRAPFLDHRLLEWAQQLPAADLVRGRQKKILLREAYRGELPDQVLDRPKHGFGAPVKRWLAGPLREQAARVLRSPVLDFSRQKNLSGQRLWTALAFEGWAERWGAGW